MNTQILGGNIFELSDSTPLRKVWGAYDRLYEVPNTLGIDGEIYGGPDNFLKYLRMGSLKVFAIQNHTQEVVGALSMQRNHIDFIGVKDQHRRQGAGSKLLLAAEQYGQKLGIEKLELYTRYDGPAYFWYIHKGYTWKLNSRRSKSVLFTKDLMCDASINFDTSRTSSADTPVSSQ